MAAPASQKAAAVPQPGQPAQPPLIPLSVMDAPTQRMWALGTYGAVQAYKFYIILFHGSQLPAVVLLDGAALLVLSRMRIPRLSFTEAKWGILGLLIILSDWLVMGGWRSALQIVGLGAVSSWISSSWSDTFSRPLGISEHRVRMNDLIRPSSHLLGQHTIHILPYSTATFPNNAASCHCVGGAGPSEIKIPVFFNNTEPTVLQYSVTSFEDPTQQTLHNITIPKSSLVMVSGASADAVGGSGSGSSSDGNEVLSWRDEVEAEVIGSSRDVGQAASGKHGRANHAANGQRHSQRSAPGMLPNSYRTNQQKIFQLPISHVGRIRLERVLDKSRLDARISRSEVLVVGCPTTSFVDELQSASVEHRCPGEQTQLNIEVSGLAPLEVSYRKTYRGLSGSVPQEQLLRISHISNPGIKTSSSPLIGGSGDTMGISNPDDALAVVLNRRRPSSNKGEDRRGDSNARDFTWAAAQTEVAPISIDLDRPGQYAYRIDTVKDACGNLIQMDDIIRHHQQHQGRGSAGQAAKKLLTSAPNAIARSSPISQRQIEVHQRAKATVVGCSAEKPLQLLRGGPARQITLKASNMERDAQWTGSLRFVPDDSASGAEGKKAATSPYSKNVTFGADGLARVDAAHPGTYTLESISGKYCSGEVGSPWSCPVVEVPSPTADISFSAIEDICAGPVGVKALAVLSGTPPFRLQYEIRRSGQHQPLRQERVIERTREEFEFRPSKEGAVQYRFTGLADANYRGLKLDGPVFEQTVHPLAKAKFAQSARQHGTAGANNNKLVMRSCEGHQVKADIDLEGTGPFDLTYVVRTGSSKTASDERVVKGIESNRYALEVDLPAHINAHGGQLTVSLVSIKDGKNCERPLATADLNVEIRRVRPTAGFIFPSSKTGQSRGETLLLEGKEASLPIRLEGEGPWKVEYVRQGDAMPVSTTIRQAESKLIVDRPGVYTLVSVRDDFCEGSVAPDAKEWQVTTRSRPSVRFDLETGVQAAKNGSILRPSVCRGTPDSVDLRLTGHFPVEVTYEQRSLAWLGNQGHGATAGRAAIGAGGVGSDGNPSRQLGFLENDGVPSSADATERSTFSAAQDTTVFQLSTEAPGWHVYELLSVGDTSYPLSNVRTSSAQSGALRLEQMVNPLPSASFLSAEGAGRSGKRASYCVGDTLTTARGAAAPTVQLSGTPPFSLEFELINVNDGTQANPSGVRRFRRSGIKTHTFKLEVDEREAESFKFDSVGQYKFRILSLQDGNGCATSSPASLGEGVGSGAGSSRRGATTIEVADTASIAPVGTREDYCVGETVDFVLSGSSPWTVTYGFNGQHSTASVRQPIFSRVAEKAGVFEIQTVAHQQNKCKRVVNAALEQGMRKTIHDLPTVRVTGGGNYIEDVREGGHADIVFSLSGTPPFSFTYQRLEAADIYSHPKVLDSHTVAGILDREYTVSTSQEGTWRVTWLQDRWCSVSIDGTGRRTSEGRARLAIME